MKSIIKRFVIQLLRIRPSNSSKYHSQIYALREAIMNLDDLKHVDDSSSEGEWIRNRVELRKIIQDHDPTRFLEWDLIKFTMCIQFPARIIDTALRKLKKNKNFASYWKKALKETEVGMPLRHIKYPLSSGQTIYQAYHFSVFEKHAKIKVSDLGHIIEFGGGYGNGLRVASNLGFKGSYSIYDLPEFSLLQKFYTSCWYPSSNDNQISTTNFGSCDKFIIDTEKLIRNKNSKSLFLATWSFTEAPADIRKKFDGIINEVDYILIGFLHTFKEVNNKLYLEKLASSLGLNYSLIPICELDGKNYYFFSK